MPDPTTSLLPPGRAGFSWLKIGTATWNPQYIFPALPVALFSPLALATTDLFQSAPAAARMADCRWVITHQPRVTDAPPRRYMATTAPARRLRRTSTGLPGFSIPPHFGPDKPLGDRGRVMRRLLRNGDQVRSASSAVHHDQGAGRPNGVRRRKWYAAGHTAYIGGAVERLTTASPTGPSTASGSGRHAGSADTQ